MEYFQFASEQWLVLSIFLLLLYGFIWYEGAKGGKTINHHELVRLLNKEEAMLIDIREMSEFNKGHISLSKNIPASKISDSIKELLAKQQQIVLVDKAGQHSGAVGKTLSREGLTVVRLKEGISGWQTNSLPLVRK